MNGPASGTARLARGMALSTTCLALSLLAHVYAGGRVHLGPAFIAGALLLSAFCVAAARRRAGVLAIGSVVATSQLLLHLLAGLSARYGSGQPMPHDMPHDMSHGTSHDMAHGMAHDMAHGMPLAMPPRMLAAHLISGVVMTVLLAQGERLVWVLTGLFARLAGPRPRHDVVLELPDRPALRARYAVPDHPVRSVIRDAVGERGPPVLPST